MGSPSGQYSKLWFAKENLVQGQIPNTGGSGTPPNTNFGMDADLGLKLYQETFQVKPLKTPFRYQENRGGQSFDHADFTPGPMQVNGTLRFALRYSGVHAVMMGHALGNLVTSGGPTFTHVADGGGNGRYNSIYWIYQRPINDQGSQFLQTDLIGSKVGRMRLSQSVAQPVIMCDMDLPGIEAKVITAVNTLLPGDGNGFAPSESLAIPQHLGDYATARYFEFKSRGGTIIPLRLDSWELELNNFPSQLAILSPALKLSVAQRGQIREVRGSFVVEQDDSLDELEAAFGNTAVDPADDAYIKWKFIDPVNSAHTLEMTLSQVYITSPERGGEGTGPQRRRFEFVAQGLGSASANLFAFPLTMVFTNTTGKPSSANPASYGSYVTGSIL